MEWEYIEYKSIKMYIKKIHLSDIIEKALEIYNNTGLDMSNIVEAELKKLMVLYRQEKINNILGEIN